MALLYALVKATVYRDPMPGSVGLDVGLKVAEVLRRWMWVFLRVEREWVERKWGEEEGDGVTRSVWRRRDSDDGVVSPKIFVGNKEND